MACSTFDRPAAIERLAALGRDLDIPRHCLHDRRRPEARADRQARAGSRKALAAAARRAARTPPRRTTLDEEMMAAPPRDQNDQPIRHEAAAGRGPADRHRSRGQPRSSFDRARRADRHRADACVDGDAAAAALRCRCARSPASRSGWIGTGEKTDAPSDLHPSCTAGRISAWRSRGVAGGRRRRQHRRREGRARRREDAQRQFDLADMRDTTAAAMAVRGGISGSMGTDARHRQDEEPDRQVRARRQNRWRRGWRSDDAAASDPDILKASRKSASPAGSGVRRRGRQQAPQNAPRNMADMMKAHGSAQARPDGRHRRRWALVARHAARKRWQRSPRRCRRCGSLACPRCRRTFPAGLRVPALLHPPGLTGPLLANKPDRCRPSAVSRIVKKK